MSGKHDGYLPASEELSEGKEIDLFYTALKGDAPREANCSLERTSVLKTSLRIRMGGPGGSHHCKYSRRNRSVILPSSTASGQITKSPLPSPQCLSFLSYLPSPSQREYWVFPSGSENPPANAGLTGLIPGPGKSHMSQSN